MSTVIQVSNLSKLYRLGEIGTGTISRDLERWYKMKIRGQEDPFLKIGETNERNKKGISDVVYSLRDINFEVQQGEALGIIGKNGAGKSTLLKIISRVTSPTTGKIKIKGRVASLLEVGTGFHPELTGRENIYLNGAILGMRKKEINSKLDEIIDFSGVERYIDTPVKRYSSGMYVRLAFAVAAHLESEILIVDEVLAVGDAEFQKKCLGKMGAVSKGEGRTVIFVSHNMSAIQALCKTCILLQNGELIKYDETRIILNKYLKEVAVNKEFIKNIEENQEAAIIFCRIIESLLELFFEIIIESKVNLEVSLDVKLKDSVGTPVGFGSFGALDSSGLISIEKGTNKIKFKIDTSKLALGEYLVSFDLTIPNKRYIDRIDDCLSFEILRNPTNNGKQGLIQKWGYGSYELDLKRI